MAKKEKAASAAKEAAKQAAPKVEPKKETVSTQTPEDAKIAEMGEILKNKQRLSPDSKVIVANLLQKRVIENPDANSFMVDGANIVIDAMLADVIVTGVAQGDDVFAMIIRKDENKYLALQSMLASQGITVPTFKNLPTPTADQLAKAGINLLPAESAVVVIDKKNVEKKVVEKKKKELKAAAEKPNLDPTKIKNEYELKKALTFIYVDSNTTPTERILKSIDFVTAYKNVQAKGDKAEEEKVAALTKEDILREVTQIIGPATFVINGIMYQPCRVTNETRLPVSAFCLVKRMFDTSKMFNEKMDDSFIAAVTKILIEWSCNSHIEEARHLITRCKVNLKKYEEDKAKNKAAIAVENTAIRSHESEIIGYEAILNSLTNVNFDIISTLVEDYKSEDKNTAKYKNAHRIVANVIKAYYPDSELSNYDEDEMLEAAKIHAGKVLNMFANPTEQNVNYIDAVLPVLTKKEKETSTEEEKEESKN